MKMLRKVLVLSVSSALLMVASSSSFAASDGGTINYTITLASAVVCTVSVNAPVPASFGTYAAATAVTLAAKPAGSVDVTCPNMVPYVLGVSAGGNYAAAGGLAANLRKLTDGANYLSYVLASAGSITKADIGDFGLQAADTSIVITGLGADTTVAAQAVGTATGNGGVQTATLSATVTTGALSPAGIYTDTVVATVAW